MARWKHLTTAPAVLKWKPPGEKGHIGFKRCSSHHISDFTIYSTWPDHVNQTPVSEVTVVMLSYEDKGATWSKDQTWSVGKRLYMRQAHETLWLGDVELSSRVKDKDKHSDLINMNT